MTGVRIDQPAARGALSAASARAQTLLAAVPDTSVPTRGLDWTVGETAAHLVADVRQFADIAMGRRVVAGGVDQIVAVTAGHLVGVGERAPAVLARLLGEAVRDFLAETAGHTGDELVAWYGGQTISAAAITCLVLGEVLVHGHDIARATGGRWSLRPVDARLALDGATWSLGSLFDPEAARGLRATYDVRVRGGSRVEARVEGGVLTVEPDNGAGVDCHISADPVALLLVGYGRTGQWGQIARGRLVAWGRKPWLGPRFATLLRNP